MPVPLDVIQAAARYQGHAVRRILAENDPRAHRLAYGLSGRADLGRRIVHQVMRQALRRMPDWHNEGEPERWFDHHTILLWRRTADIAPKATADLLVTAIHEPSAQYTAFVRALRHLPPQQREAFLLAAGEGYDTRQSGIAMDCSRTAAANHLATARTALATVSGGEEAMERHAITLGRAWNTLSQTATIPAPSLNRAIALHIWRRRLRRLIGWCLILVLLALLIGVGWYLWRAAG